MAAGWRGAPLRGRAARRGRGGPAPAPGSAARRPPAARARSLRAAHSKGARGPWSPPAARRWPRAPDAAGRSLPRAARGGPRPSPSVPRPLRPHPTAGAGERPNLQIDPCSTRASRQTRFDRRDPLDRVQAEGSRAGMRPTTPPIISEEKTKVNSRRDCPRASGVDGARRDRPESAAEAHRAPSRDPPDAAARPLRGIAPSPHGRPRGARARGARRGAGAAPEAAWRVGRGR